MSPSGSVVVLSTTTVIVISITSLLVAVLCGFLVGMMVQRAINRKMRLDSNAVLADDLLPTSVTHTSELTPVYEDILPPKNRRKLNFKHMDQFHSREINHLSACLYLAIVIRTLRSSFIFFIINFMLNTITIVWLSHNPLPTTALGVLHHQHGTS